jgi:hypothetical protein
MTGSDRTTESRFGDRDQAGQGTRCDGLVDVQVESGASIGLEHVACAVRVRAERS